MRLQAWVIKQSKKKARIYIMPTRMGGYLNGLIFLMFLLSVGYNNNLLLIFTLVLFGLNLIWVIQSHFHLQSLKLDNIQLMDGHALDAVQCSVQWKKAPELPHRWEIDLVSDEKIIRLVSFDETLSESRGSVVFATRGVFDFEHLRVKTEMPFGLYRAWVYFPYHVRGHSYPTLLQEVPELEALPSNKEGESEVMRPGPHDIWNLSPYSGQEARKINWKHYARSGELVVKEGQELTDSVVHFRLNSLDQNKEFVLSQVATQMVHCSRTGTAFGLETPQKRFGIGHDQKHLKACLRELAAC